MTESVQNSTVATQTPLPKTQLSLPTLATKPTLDKAGTQRNAFEEQMQRNDILLQQQMNALQAVDKNLKKTIESESLNNSISNATDIGFTEEFLQNEISNSNSLERCDSLTSNKVKKIFLRDYYGN